MMSDALHQTRSWISAFPVNFWRAGFALRSPMPSGSLPVCQEQCVDYSQTPPSLSTHGDRPSCDDTLFRWSVKELASLITLRGFHAAVICHPRDSKPLPTMPCGTALNSTTPPLFIDAGRNLWEKTVISLKSASNRGSGYWLTDSDTAMELKGGAQFISFLLANQAITELHL